MSRRKFKRPAPKKQSQPNFLGTTLVLFFIWLFVLNYFPQLTIAITFAFLIIGAILQWFSNKGSQENPSEGVSHKISTTNPKGGSAQNLVEKVLPLKQDDLKIEEVNTPKYVEGTRSNLVNIEAIEHKNAVSMLEYDVINSPTKNLLIKFLEVVGPPPNYEFTCVTDELPERLIIYKSQHISTAFSKVEIRKLNDQKDAVGRVAIFEYKSFVESTYDLAQIIKFELKRYVTEPFQTMKSIGDEYYFNLNSGWCTFIGRKKRWIIHGVFPISESYLNYVHKLFAVDQFFKENDDLVLIEPSINSESNIANVEYFKNDDAPDFAVNSKNTSAFKSVGNNLDCNIEGLNSPISLGNENKLIQFLNGIETPQELHLSDPTFGLTSWAASIARNFSESAFVRLNQTTCLDNKLGEICVLKYRTIENAKIDLKTMIFYKKKFSRTSIDGVSNINNEVFIHIKDAGYSFFARTGNFIVYGNFPNQENGLQFLVKIFSLTFLLDPTFEPIKVEDVSAQDSISKSQNHIIEKSNVSTEYEKYEEAVAEAHTDEFTTYKIGDEKSPTPIFAIPKAYEEPIKQSLVQAKKILDMPGRWLQKGESISIAGFTINTGMIYAGTELSETTEGNGDEPSFINLKLPIDAETEYNTKQMWYWPRYSQISPKARGAYLKWLESGKCDPKADIGFVFLYFYGIERRVLVDLAESESSSERVEIVNELERLISIYGSISRSFKMYCSRLLDYAQASTYEGNLYNQPLPNYEDSIEIPLHLRILIGQCMKDGIPLTVEIVKAWILHDPTIEKGTYSQKNRSEFLSIFEVLFKEKYGSGLLIPACATRLKYEYKPASAGFNINKPLKLTFSNIPDIKAVTAPLKKIQEIINAAIAIIDPVRRVLTRYQNLNSSIGYLALPHKYWPSVYQGVLEKIIGRCENSLFVLSGKEIGEILQFGKQLPTEIYNSFVSELEKHSIGVEPSLSESRIAPGDLDKIALFKLGIESNEENSNLYKSAAAMVDLASAVANSDGHFSADEVKFIHAQIDSWDHLALNSRIRLRARTRLLIDQPLSAQSIKGRIKQLDVSSKLAMAKLSATLVNADGVVSPAEVKFLEKIYKLLDISPSQVANDIHAATPSSSKTQSAVKTVAQKAKAPGFQLDRARIASLQTESDQVAQLLGNIFSDESPSKELHDLEVEETTTSTDILEELPTTNSNLFGLDAPHSAFLRMLVSRTEWTRIEVEALAADLELMTDGALEKLNEIAYDKFDMPLTEGDDIIEINPELIENIIV